MKKYLALAAVLLAAATLTAGGAQEVPAETAVPVIRIVSKDVSESNAWDKAHLENITEGFIEYIGEEVVLEFVEMPEGAYAEKLNLMLLGGDIPDLIYFQGGDEAISQQGILEDLRPYVAASSVMQKALMDFNRERMENYPYLLWIAPPRARTAVVREDWFVEAGGKIPQTVDEYYTLFAAIKKNHPGVPVLTDTGNTDRMDYTFDLAFGNIATWFEENGSLVYKGVSQAQKDKLAFYQRLYAEGILDNDYITTKWDTMEDKLYTGKAAMVFGTAGIVLDIYDNKLKQTQDTGLVALPPAQGVAQGYPVSSAKETRGWAVSALSEHKDLTFKLLEYLATDEGQFLERYGLEGIHHTVSDGKVNLTEESGNWWPRFHEVMAWDAPTPLLGPAGQKGWDFILKYAVGDPDFPIPEELSPTWDALGNLQKEYTYKIISGEYSIDKFDEFVTEWYALGGDKVTAYARTVL
ncbi:MAG: extracellular solute-binding protein [Spirochaetia bacterium]|nr:extracellular solute-binding protein [Spirochaetia bacterium]